MFDDTWEPELQTVDRAAVSKLLEQRRATTPPAQTDTKRECAKGKPLRQLDITELLHFPECRFRFRIVND